MPAEKNKQRASVGKGAAVRRQNKKNLRILKAAAAISSADFGVWAYERWEDLNRRLFEDALPVGEINWGLTPHGACIGCYHAHRNLITMHTTLITPGTWSFSTAVNERLKDTRFAEDVLLHEMVHQSVTKRLEYALKSTETSHNNDAWVDEIIRISKILRLPIKAEVIKPRRIKGKLARKARPGYLSQSELARWPHCIRPARYYRRGTKVKDYRG